MLPTETTKVIDKGTEVKKKKYLRSYYNKRYYSNADFWFRLGGKPPLESARVLEVGCGLGSLTIDMALAGAKKVVGIDLSSRKFANENLKQNYPQLVDVVEFVRGDLKDYPEFDFDYIVSKDCFEHVMNLDEMLDAIKMRLKPGGKLYAGFGPLWNSPFGPHGSGVIKNSFPWWHLLVGEARYINLHNLHRPERKISSIYELGLNKLSLADYRRIFQNSGLSIISFQVNRSNNPISKFIAKTIKNIPFLEEYFSHNIYCVLEKAQK